MEAQPLRQPLPWAAEPRNQREMAAWASVRECPLTGLVGCRHPRDPLKIPHLPRWYCSRLLDHYGYLREVRKIDEHHSEYVCRACGWTGVR
jgi:hypothetical protein